MNFPIASFIVYLLALLPAIGWILVYRYLDSRDPEPFRSTSFSLIAGILSTIPVFFLQYLFSQYPKYDFISYLQGGIQSPLLFSAFFLVFVAVIEEFVKGVAFLTVLRRYEKSFNQIVDGIVYAAFVGIGFALAENMYYFTRAIDAFQFSGNLMAVFSIRSIGTMLAHTLFTGLFGFYFAKAYFSPIIDADSRDEKIWHNLGSNLRHAIRLHVTFFHLLPAREGQKTLLSIKRNVMIIEGYLVAVLVHFLYNALIKLEVLGKNWTFLIVPLLFVVSWFVWSRFFIPLYVKIIEFVRIKKTNLYKARVH